LIANKQPGLKPEEVGHENLHPSGMLCSIHW